MANFFNILNKKIIINSSKISNPSLKDAIILNSERVAGDLSSIASYNNQVIYEVFRKLCSKPEYPYDAVESGLSGNTVVTYLEEDGNNSFNSPIYWSQDQNRPNTIKESFDYVISNLGIQEVIRENESPDLGNIIAQIRCSQKNLNKLRKDTIGCNDEYFTCNDQPELEWPISKHLYELFTQGIISGHDETLIADLDNICDPAGTEYPDLKLTIKTDGIEEGASLIPQKFIEGCKEGLNLEIQLDSIQHFIGMQCDEELEELAKCSSLKIAKERSLKDYIEKILERLCSLGDEGIDAVYLGVRDPAAGEDGNIQDAKPLNENTYKTSDSLKYFHSSDLKRKGHWFTPSGDEQIVIGEFVTSSRGKENISWGEISEYSNPIPYTLFCYTSNKFLSGYYEEKLIARGTLKREDNRVPSVCLFEEITSFQTVNSEFEYKYEQIGGVIRNDLTVSDREKDTGAGILLYTDLLYKYHEDGNSYNFENHLQISGHAPVICIGPVDFGDKLIPVPLKWQQEIFGSTLEIGYGFVCSDQILDYSYLKSLYNNQLSGLDKKVGISLSSTRNIFNKENNFVNMPLARTMHEDVYDNIINKAKPTLNINQVFGPGGGPQSDVWKVLSIQYMRIML